MTSEEAGGVLLGFLSYSNQQYFVQQYQYVHSDRTTPCDLSQCFQVNVTDASLRNTLSIVNLLRQRYLDHYQQAKEADDAKKQTEVETVREAQVEKEEAEREAMEAARREDAEAAKVVQESAEALETRRKLKEATKKLDAILASKRNLLNGKGVVNGPNTSSSVLNKPSTGRSMLNEPKDDCVLNSPPSNGIPNNNVEQLSNRSLLGTSSLHVSSRSLNGTSNRNLMSSGVRYSLPGPPTSTPILKQSDTREQNVVDMEREGAVEDEMIDLDIDLGELDSVVLTNSSPALAPTKHTLRRRRGIEERLEDGMVCRFLYEAIQLLHAQLVYVSNTNRLAVPSLLIRTDSPIPLLNELIGILNIDSSSVAMSLVKKETVETLATLSCFCNSLPALEHLLQEVLSLYQAAKLEDSAGSYALLDVIFGLLQGLDKYGLWERLVFQGDLLQNCLSITSILSGLFQGIQNEFGPYTKRLTSEHHQINASGLTRGVNTILNILHTLFNEAYNKTINGDVTAFTRLTGLSTAIVQLCNPLLSFCLTLLEQSTNTILWVNSLSSSLLRLFSC